MRVLSKKLRRSNPFWQKLDRVASDLNVSLMVFAVGLATLDLTFLLTQKVVDRLPQVTRVVDTPSPSPQISAPVQQK